MERRFKGCEPQLEELRKAKASGDATQIASAQYNLAAACFQMNLLQVAIANLQEIIQNYSKQEIAAKAQYLLARCYYYQMRPHKQVIFAYQTIIDKFPKCEWSDKAAYMIVRCLLHS